MNRLGKLSFPAVAILAAALVIYTSPTVMAKPSYKAVKITFPIYTIPYELNANRQVLISPQGTDIAPIIWTQDTSISLPAPSAPYNLFYGLAINDQGYVCGDARNTSFSSEKKEVYFWDGSLQILDVVPAGMVNPSTSTPWGFSGDINNSNDIAGTVVADSGRYRAVVWHAASGKPDVLETLNNYNESWGRAINDNGVVAADATVSLVSGIASNRAFVWNQGSVSELASVDGRSESSTWALDINSQGWVCGRSEKFDSTLGSDARATLWQNGTPIDLIGTPVANGSYSNAAALNDAGSVVISGSVGFLWEDDTLYQISDLITNILYDDSTAVPFIQLPLSINNMGDILTREGALLIRQPEGIVVNSTGDAPDLDPNDGRAYTGGVNSIGDDECTLRSAIQHANGHAGLDTIIFSIPGSGIPSIKVSSSLPDVTEAVIINALTQPTTNMVELSGENLAAKSADAATDGITFTGGNSSLRGLMINRFSGNGITLQSAAGHDTIQQCIIGTNPAGDSLLGNTGHGIYIESSSNNQILHSSDTITNVVAFNGGTGIFVQSGNKNTISGNSVYHNGNLGIDLAPVGVTPNDSADFDTGANDLTNFPVIDSVVSTPSQITVYGTLLGNQVTTYEVEFFKNEYCDSTGYGEGRKYLGSTAVVPDAISGIGTFAVSFYDSLKESQSITATTTDDLGNTSEFSACSSRRKLLVKSYYNIAMENTQFQVSKVSYARPNFTESQFDTITTDSDGYIYLDDISLGVGDTLKLYKYVHAEPASKHFNFLPTKYSVQLDNADFDSTGAMSYFEIKDSIVQTVVVQHATWAFNLVVSIEWDAKTNYLQETVQGLRNMCNYIYDVSNGQIRFDTVMIFDNKVHWAEADLVVHASNILWPHVDQVFGINRGEGPKADPVEMPRKWFGNVKACRVLSFTENPLLLSSHWDYRTRVHEFGHYALGFKDEYKFVGSNGRCSVHPISSPNANPYGFMDSQYRSDGPHSSEMSSSASYASSSCRNTRQWVFNRQSCWDFFEIKYGSFYGPLYAGVVKPGSGHITLMSGFDYIPGPNDNMNNLDYDVGALMTFTEPVNAPATNTLAVTVRSLKSGNVFKNASVALRKVAEKRTMLQGKVDTLGHIRVLGVSTGDTILASGRVTVDSLTKSAASGYSWLFGSVEVAAADSMDFPLSEVAGSYPLIAKMAIDSVGGTYELDATNLFAGAPLLDLVPDGDSLTSHPMTVGANNYTVSIGDSLRGFGTATITAVDDSGAAFYFSTDYTIAQFDSGFARQIQGPDGASQVAFDSTNTGLSSAGILTSPYPVIRTGIDPLAYQAGDAHAISVYPNDPLQGENDLTIHYDESDFDGGVASFSSETSLRIFHWNVAAQMWEVIGGVVDTAFDEVTAPITETGVYAAFTTEIGTDVGERGGRDNSLPTHFDVRQNYPNPFNPTTVISYSIPSNSEVEVEIFNVLGQHVWRYSPGKQVAGTYSVTWDATDISGQRVASGMYFYRVTAGEYSATRKMILLK